MAPREKENAKEWQIKEEAGVHKGNVHNYFNEGPDEDQTSESASEGPAPAQAEQLTANLGARPRPSPGNPGRFQKVSYKKPPGKPKHKQSITFAARIDNAARVAFRNGQPPSVAFDLGSPLTDIEPSVARLQRTLAEIGVRFGSFILPKRSLNETKVVIWGNKKQVDDTITELKQWRRCARSRSSVRESRSIGKEHFAKISSSIGVMYAADEKTAKRDAERQHFQAAPRQGQRFKFNGYFLWPNNEIRAADLFGPNCEALDPLRLEHRAHITFDGARSVLKIHSDRGADKISQVIERIESTVKEYVARNHRPATLLLVETLNPTDYRQRVRTISGPLLGVNQAPSKVPMLCGEESEDQNIAKLQQEAEKLDLRNKSRTHTAAKRILERLPYYRGHIRMRVNFGTFALIKFQWPPGAPAVTLEKFIADVQSAGTKGTLIRK
ncbi:MAG: hypothetical protein LQ338_003199 [Usnochroma carphineum]|nr:MAG: hypothetical protein LQ338_003199 [Usnochroma carphineum]